MTSNVGDLAPPGAPDRRSRAMRTGLRGAAAAARALGPARHRVGDAIGLVALALDRERRRRTAANHRRADPGLDARGASRRARDSFREYGRTTVDFVWACGLDDAQVLANSVVIGLERALRPRSGTAILTLTHHGNWDMAANVAAAHGLTLTTVMAPIGSPRITDLVIWARRRNQLEVYTPDRAARGLVRALRSGRYVAILCDIPGGGPETVVTYCGGPVVFSTVPWWLADRTGAPLLPVTCVRGERADAPYVVTVHPEVAVAGRTAAEVMQEVADVLGAEVRRSPTQWYPFADVYAEADSGPPA